MLTLVSLWSCDECGAVLAETGGTANLGKAGWTLGEVDRCGECSTAFRAVQDWTGERGVALEGVERCP